MEITKTEAKVLCEFIEGNILDNIRNDTDIDNMSWLVTIIDLFKRMADFSEYDGLTYPLIQKEVEE